jgi:hypothetical protein
MKQKRKEHYFDLAMAYMRGDPELTDLEFHEDTETAHFVRWWDQQSPNFRQVVSSVFQASESFYRKKTKKKVRNLQPHG